MRKHLSPFGKLERVENSAGIGTPDVCYCLSYPTAVGRSESVSGWLELKELDEWPKRATTPIRIPKLKIEQVLWLEAWHAAGGDAMMLLQVQREYFLLPPVAVRSIWNRAAIREQLQPFALSALDESGSFPTRNILKCLVG
jgi:hypothetical protein